MRQVKLVQVAEHSRTKSKVTLGYELDALAHAEYQEAILVSTALSRIKEEIELRTQSRILFESSSMSPTSMIIDYYNAENMKIVARYRLESREKWN